MEEKMKLNLKLVNEILGYLGSRPFQEVAGLINGIQQEAQVFNKENQAIEKTVEKKK